MGRRKMTKIKFPDPNFKTYVFEIIVFECPEYKNVIRVLDNNGLFGIWQSLIMENQETIWRLPFGCS
jgi:hypothetical protein